MRDKMTWMRRVFVNEGMYGWMGRFPTISGLKRVMRYLNEGISHFEMQYSSMRHENFDGSCYFAHSFDHRAPAILLTSNGRMS